MAENPKNAEAQRKWRKTKRGRAIMAKHLRDTVDERVARNAARRKMVKKYGKAKMKGKSVHHKDGKPGNNSDGNLAIAKRYHGRRPGVKNKK
jgi:hypothetical protein